ncbi:MAG: endonuclease MutS2 [Coprobacillaceae bacterium]
MKDTYTTLEFHHILQQVQQYSVSPVTKDVILQLDQIEEYDELLQTQEYIKEAMYILQNFGRLPLSYFKDINHHLQKTKKDGVLFGEDFININQQLQNVKEIKEYLEEQELPDGILVQYIEQLQFIKPLWKHINTCIDYNGQMLDTASPELRRIRRTMLSAEASIRSKIMQIQQDFKDLLSQETVASRNEHLVLPVKAVYKNRVKGIVHAISASGQTIFVEPDAVVQIHNQVVQLQEEEKREIHRILVELSKEVKENYVVLYANQVILLSIDEIFSKAQYGVSINGCIPEVKLDYSNLILKEARHPLIDPNDIVSNDIVIVDGKRTLLISGSNTGGKTVVLKTVGLLSIMALSGLAVPCFEATIPFFDDIFVDLGDEQSIEQSLSTFSSHMKRLVSITENVTDKSLVLLDEIGSGTDPQEGQSIAQAILMFLYKKQALTVASTHYSGLKQFAKQEDYIVVAAVEFDQEKMQPTYRLLPGNVGNSYAIEISKRLGLSLEIVERATKIKEANLSESDRLLERLQNELTAIQIERDTLDTTIKEALQNKQKYERALSKVENEKDAIIKKAKEEANILLEESKAYVDTVVEELKASSEIKPHIVIQAKKTLDDIKFQEENVLVETKPHTYEVGDIVKVLSVGREGTVLSINKKGILTIDMGGLKLTAKTNEVSYLRKKEKPKKIKTNINALKRASSQGLEINVIGQRYEEAMLAVDKFLDNALIQNYSRVRIVHGMGTGVLRKGVRQLLDKNRNVVSYRDGGPNEGGLGATLAYFE